MSFTALVLRENKGRVESAIEQVGESQLPAGDVLIKVEYSSLNYKDAMVLNGLGRLVRRYPHVPGIDLAGIVEESTDDAFRAGDRVVLTGWRVGELSWGGYAGKARVQAHQLIKLPLALTTQQAMMIGTAGLTAMLSVMMLERSNIDRQGAVLVTGAGGGVGSVAVAILAQLGYQVTASTGRPDNADYLHGLGAREVIDRVRFSDGPLKPLESESWAGAVDTVGGKTLAAIIAQLAYRGSVAACGLVGGADLPSSVIPFLLRGVNLLGIDSVMCPLPERHEAWTRLATSLPHEKLGMMMQTVTLEQLPHVASEILKGNIRGRVVVDLQA